jgi:hypothetical protein
MKPLIILLFISIFTTGFSQCDVTTMSCCSYQLIDTLDQSEFTTINTSPHTSITPPPGYAVHFTQPPIMKVYNDGSSLIFASGEMVSIENDETQFSGNYLSRFGDSFIYRNGIYSGSFWHNYQCVYSGETIMTSPSFVSAGRIYVTSTYPITGGGPDAKIIFTFTYELIPY